MKRLLLSLSVVILQMSLAMAEAKFAPDLVIEGAKGQQIVYNPAGTVLENETNLKCVLYVYRNYWWQATDLPLRQVEAHWRRT